MSLVLVLVGLIAGLLGGLLGIGGSIVMIPSMRELMDGHGGDQHLYQAAAMIVNFFVITPSVVQHLRARAVVWPVVRRLAPAAVICVIGGVLLSEAPVFRSSGEVYLAGVFGLFLFYVVAVNVHRLITRPATAVDPRWDPEHVTWHGPVAVGIAVGLVGGLLGIGGGVISVPLQQRFLHIPLRNAIANSAVTIIPLSIVGATLKNYELVSHHDHTLREPLVLAALLIPTAIAGGFIGGRLTHSLPLRVVRGAFVLLILIAAIRMSLRAFSA
jgi:uncharacterized membrane protein YfcA